jgi:uncharacterized repeat protein (TIGR01451 family)
MALAVLLTLAQLQSAMAAIVNDAIAVANNGAVVVTSLVSSQAVPVAPAAPAMAVAKTGVLNDDDGTPGLSAGDTISYTLKAENNGNVTLTGIGVADPLVALVYQAGDTDGDTAIDVGETWTYTGSYTLLQADLDGNGGGDGDIDNTATVTSAQLPPQTALAVVVINPTAALGLTKSVATTAKLFPGVYRIEYSIAAENTGSLTLSNLRIADDLGAAFAPGSVFGAPTVTLAGFAGPGGANPAFDGSADTQLLAGDVQLAPGQTGTITLTADIALAGASGAAANTAYGSSDQIAGPVASDDPTVTPGDPGDVNPAPFAVADGDGDGAPDTLESAVGDRDGDGIADAGDYDPTGYFYCEADGRLMAGGLITVENLSLGGTQTGIGSNANITVVRDGGDGRYQFQVTAAGTYRLSYALPPGGVASTTRLPGGPLDLTTFLPTDPAVLGSGEAGASGLLADAAAAANPFHLDFVVEPGDPTLFNNNIPLQFCGTPQLGATKQTIAGPTLQGDGRSAVTWRITATNTGNERVDQVQARDDLATAFGAAGYAIVSVTLAAAPPGFGAAADPLFDGNGSIALLTAGGSLNPGESVAIDIALLLDVPPGNWTNTASADGVSPLDGSAVGPVGANASVDIAAPPAAGNLVVAKTAGAASARLGERIVYTIAFTNDTATAQANIDLVDRIPPGFGYVPGSATIDNVAAEPARTGNELVWPGRTVAASSTVTIRLLLVVGAGATGSEFVNYALARDGLSGTTISNIASATVRRQAEPVFDCAEVVGRVFDDKNHDGVMQDGEPGLPGVRIATARGLLVTTDKAGRFHVACPMIPADDIGSNFVMKLDVRTLPDGYRVTSENPRVIRLTKGKLAKLDFGAAGSRIVALDLDARSFEPGGAKLSATALQALGALLRRLEEEPSTLRITYRASTADRLGQARIDAVEILIDSAWKAKSRPHRLTIEKRLSG